MYRCFTMAALMLALPLAANAQTRLDQTSTTTTTTASTSTPPQTPIYSTGTPSRWVVSGFVGQNFGAATDGTSMNFGGSLGYLAHGKVGAEVLADFAPKFQFQNSAVLLGVKPQVNSYMGNIIGAAPLGADGQWSPYVSGGLGAITLRAGTSSSDNAVENVVIPDDSKFGGNVGGGVMGFAGNVGLRADVRYFRAFHSTDNNPSSVSNAIAGNLLNGLDFWRANVGIAIRW
jgi:hypothetical protein